MADGVEPVEADFDIARTGIMVQVEAHGLTHLLSDEAFVAFINHQVKVKAADMAYIRMQSNALFPSEG